MRLLLAWAILVLVSLPVLGQDCELRLHGLVVQSDNNEPLAYAKVLIEELNRTVLTDSNGYYQINDLCPGTYTLVCSHQFCDHEVLVCKLDHENTEFRFKLETHTLSLGPVTIRGHRKKDEPIQAESVLKGLALDQLKAKGLGEAVASLPGVNLLRTGATISKPVIHGLHSSRVLILNHGIRLEGQQWGSEHAPEIDPFLATRLSVIKGAASVRYGSGAIAGVILVEPAALPDSSGLAGDVYLQGFSNGRQGLISAKVENKFEKLPLSWRVQGTLKRGGNLHTPDYFLENTGLLEQNFSLDLGTTTFRKGVEVFYNQFHTQLGILSPSHINSQLDLERALERTIPLGADTVGFDYHFKRPYQDISHHLTKVQAFQRVGDHGKLSFTYAWQFNHRREFDKHRPRGTDENGKDIAELDFRIHTHTLEGLWEHNSWKSWKGSMGLFGLYQNNYLRGRPFIPNFVALGGDAFWIERYQKNNWEFEMGTRYEYRYVQSAREEDGVDIYTEQQFQNVSGTLGLKTRINEFLQWRTHIATAWRPPNVNELFSDGLHHGAAAVEIGDSTLRPEQALKAIMEVELTNFRGWGGELSLYYQHFFNFIYQRPDGFERTIRGTFPRITYAETEARLAGADLEVYYNSPWGLRWETRGSFLQADNLGDGEPLIFMPANRVQSGVQYTLNSQGAWQNPFLKLNVQHVFEQKRVPLDQDFLPPPAAYTLSTLSGGIRYNSQAYYLDIGFEVSNLFNVQYRDYLNRFRYYADELGRNISLRLRYHF